MSGDLTVVDVPKDDVHRPPTAACPGSLHRCHALLIPKDRSDRRRVHGYVVQDTVYVEPGDWNTAVAQGDEGDQLITGGCEFGTYTFDGHTMGSVVRYIIGPIDQDDGPDTFRQGLSVAEQVTRIHARAFCNVGSSRRVLPCRSRRGAATSSRRSSSPTRHRTA